MKQELEGVANEAIRADHEVLHAEMPLADAKALGAQAMFGEKYGEIVRVVEFGDGWSRELCGGTHVAHTAQIGLLSLLGEGSIGSGVRRVEAFVSQDAFAFLAAERALVTNLADILKVQPDQLEDRVGKLIAETKSAQKELAALKLRRLLDQVPALVGQAVPAGRYELVAQTFPDMGADDARTLAADARTAFGSRPGVVALVAGDVKPMLIVATTQAARDLGAKAGTLVGIGAVALGGKGGGRDDLAQGGGTFAAGTGAALAAVRHALEG